VFYIVELKQQLNVATNEADRFREQLSQLTANRWEPLRQNEIVSLRALIRPMAPQPFSVACNFDSCNELGQSIYDVFHDLKWPGTYHMALYQMNSDYIYIQPMTQRQQSLVQLKVPQKVG
jgi:hypothetical protein